MKVYINSSLKNTKILLLDSQNKILFKTSSKSYQYPSTIIYKLKNKNQAYVFLQLVQYLKKHINKYLKKNTINDNKKTLKPVLQVFIKGFNFGRRFITVGLQHKFLLKFIKNETRLAFNGCRLKKIKRR